MEKYKFIYKKILEKNKKIYLFMTVLMIVETIFFLGNLEILTNVRNEKQAINDIQTKNLYDMELLVNGSENIEDKIKYLLDGITDGCDLISVYQSSQIASDNKNKQMNLIMITKEIASVYKPKLKSGQWITDKKYDSSHIPVVVSKEMSKKYKIGKSYILNDSMHETKNYNIVVTGVLESNYYLDLEYSPSISSDENLMIALNSNYKTDEIVYEEAMGTNIIVR